MKTKYYYAFLISYCFGMSSCSSTLVCPLLGGVEKGTSSDHKVHSQSRIPAGTTIYLEPRNSLEVRSIENCRILSIIYSNETGNIIVAKGKIDAGYGNLRKCYVSKGAHALKGQVIGELFAKDSVYDNSLSMSLSKDGKSIMPKW